MNKLKVKQVRRNSPFLIVLCGLFALSTIILGWLACKNAKPLECEQFSIKDDVMYCDAPIK